MKKHLIIAIYDGVASHYSGVGTIAKNMVNTLIKFSQSSQTKISIAYVNVDKKSGIFDSKSFEAAKYLTDKTVGNMIPLCNSTKGQTEWDMWGSFNEWKFSCVSLVTALNLLLDPSEKNTILLNDTPFLFFAKYKELVLDKNLKCFYIPLSTGRNHAFGDKEWRGNRIRAEEECFSIINKDPNSKVVSPGSKFAERMHDDYGLNFNKKDYLQNGLCFNEYESNLNEKLVIEDLKTHGIDIGRNKKIIFAWGRCSIAKGFRELANAWVLAHEQLPEHYLILQIPNNSGENDYFLDIKDILKDIPRVIIIDNFDPNIWKAVLRNESTDVVCIPSLMDSFPHTSIEAKLFSKGMNYITIISDVDGAIDAFEEHECIYVDPRNTELFARKIIEAATMNQKQRRKIIDSNIETINKFNFQKILEKFINDNT